MKLTKYHAQALGIFAAVALTVGAAVLAVASIPEKIITHSERVTVEVVSVYLTTKTNSKVNLKVVGSSQVYRDNRLSCSKDKASNVRIGSKWDVTVEDYKRGDRYGSDVLGTSAICTKSN